MQVTKKIYDLQSLNFLRNTKLKIGILGGSFNPAHSGHLLISKQAIDLYKLDYVIWLVANQNPFKPEYNHNIFERAKAALDYVDNPKIIISTAEYDFQSYYLYDSLKRLLTFFPNNEFTWLMGIDNLSHFHNWYRSKDIVKLCKIIIFDRPTPGRFINNSNFTLKYKPILAKTQTHNIIIHKGMMDQLSSSQIRNL
jgi:nicotinate-nucleotide adenylyltransferase